MDWLPLVTLISSIATTIGVFLAGWQIRKSGQLHRTQFEDSLAGEYRELMQNVPVNALLGAALSDEEFSEARRYLFHYISLTNDQIFLRSKGRVCEETWRDWQTGIRVNMQLPAVRRMWGEISAGSKNFLELRQLVTEGYDTDPYKWTSEPSEKLLLPEPKTSEPV